MEPSSPCSGKQTKKNIIGIVRTDTKERKRNESKPKEEDAGQNN